VALDEVLGRLGRLRLPPLAVALGIYLPSGTISAVVAGAVAGWAYERWVGQGERGARARRLGVILASGLIVGESLFSVALAGAIAAAKTGLLTVADSDFPLGLVGEGFGPAAVPLGLVAFVGGVGGLYRWIRRLSGDQGGRGVDAG
jgi:OPT oligopeptide transporter protein